MLFYYNDAVRPFKGKTKLSVTSQSQYTRTHLANAAFSLKEVCETLMGAVINIIKVPSQNNQATIVSEIANKMQDNLANMMKDFEKNLMAKMNMPNTNNRNKRLHPCGDHENHVIVVENEEEGENGYTEQKWSEVVSKNISEKLKGIPVDKTSINKDGKGCVFFPS